MQSEIIYSDKATPGQIKEYTDYIIGMALSSFSEDKKRDKLCWDIYTGKHDNSKFNYLTKVEGFTFPARFRNIGNEIVRSKLNLLESKQMRRIFRFHATAMDERSLKQKLTDRVSSRIKAINEM